MRLSRPMEITFVVSLIIAVLAFLIAGPATRIPPLMALATIVRPLFIFAYVLLLIAYSVVAGLLYGLI